MDFLINIPAKISKFYDGLAKLFEDISTFMKKFKIYQRIEQYAKIDELKMSTHKLMIVFVDVCAISIHVLGGSKLEKAKFNAKVALFDNDSGVQAKLDEFKGLIDQQSQISDAMTLEHVLSSEGELTSSMKKVFDTLKRDAEHSRQQLEASSQNIQSEMKSTHDDVRSIQKFADDATDREKRLRLLEEARKKLSINTETRQASERALDQLNSEILDHTGRWLEGLDIFQNWMKLEPENHASQLLLSGPAGSGKSFLACAILQRVPNRYNIASTNPGRVLTAFHQIKKSEKPSRDGPIKESLKIMASQLASQDLVYLKNLHDYLESQDLTFANDIEIGELIDKLISPMGMRESSTTAFVLVFDGLDQLPRDEANQLFAASLNTELRNINYLFTGTENVFQSCSEHSQKELDSMPLIRVADHNESDIRHFLDSQLKAHEGFQISAPDIQHIVDSMQGKIPKIAKGKFEDVRYLVDVVNKAADSLRPLKEIEALISEDTLKNKDAEAKRLINGLNRSLTPQEIEQLNEILIWTIYALETMYVNQVEAAVYLGTKRIPLQNLKYKVVQKYSELLQIDEDGMLEIKNDSLETYFRESKRDKVGIDVETHHDPNISMKITIDNVKLSKVQRFFWDLSEKVVLDKFLFTNPLTGPSNSLGISANSVEAHITITKRCFDLLLDDPDEMTKEIAPYALVCLPTHLWILRQNEGDDSLEPTEKVEIVDNLVSLLSDPKYMKKHLTKEFFQRNGWLDEEVEIQSIGAWLSDPQATDKLDRRGRAWLKQAASGRLTALKDLAMMVARQWLCERTWSAGLPFQWLDSFLDRLADDPGHYQRTSEQQAGENGSDSIRKNVNQTSDDPVETPMSAQARVIRAADWAEKEAEIVKSSLYYERLGSSYLYMEETELSEEAFLSAKRAPDSSWKISEGLAETYAESDKRQLAVQELETALSYLKGKEKPSVEEKDCLLKYLIRIAGWQVELENVADAIAKLKEAIKLDEQHYASHYELIKLFIVTDQESEALAFLGEMKMQPGQDNLTRLESMLLDFSNWEDSIECFRFITHVTRHHEISSDILQSLERSLKYARERKTDSGVIDLLLGQGVALARHSTTEEGLEYALKQWIECCKTYSASKTYFSSTTQDKWLSVITATQLAFNSYFSQAKLRMGEADDFEILVDKINDLVKHPKMIFAKETIDYQLGSLYSLSNKQDMARKQLWDEMKSGLEFLSDDDPENDFIGYQILGNVLLHAGDDLNALSAWSLFGPSERYGRSTKLPKRCDGRCNNPLNWADSVWFCKVCEDVQFHDECLEKLQKGTLIRFVCSSDHEWLRIPPWVDEYKATGKDHVRTGGELQDGKRIGGEIVPVDAWLTMIREEWGFENPTAEKQAEDSNT